MFPPPPLKQESHDTCALACLRMILSGQGVGVSAAALAERAKQQPGGVDIEDLRDLAVAYGLGADIRQLNAVNIAALLTRSVYPIVYLNRAYFDRPRLPPRAIARRTAV